jgi:2-polyprenyl-6-methoxyphenol hydroxylase-like FAD-dependent oxidoreductase
MERGLELVRRAYGRDPEAEWRRLEAGTQARLEHLITSYALERHLPPPDSGERARRAVRVLDAGGGPGRYTIQLAERGYRLTLLDLSPELLDLARQRFAAAAPAVRADVQGQFMAVIDQFPEFAERVRAGRREERFYGATDLPNFYRKPFGPGWALVGDAGCHKDPFLALGICDSLRDAELLAEAAHEGLAGDRPLEAALAEYERRRNQACLPDYRENVARARLGPPTWSACWLPLPAWPETNRPAGTSCALRQAR